MSQTLSEPQVIIEEPLALAEEPAPVVPDRSRPSKDVYPAIQQMLLHALEWKREQERKEQAVEA